MPVIFYFLFFFLTCQAIKFIKKKKKKVKIFFMKRVRNQNLRLEISFFNFKGWPDHQIIIQFLSNPTTWWAPQRFHRPITFEKKKNPLSDRIFLPFHDLRTQSSGPLWFDLGDKGRLTALQRSEDRLFKPSSATDVEPPNRDT